MNSTVSRRIANNRKIPLILAGSTLFLLSAYIGLNGARYTQDRARYLANPLKPSIIDSAVTYDKVASTFDSEVRKSEWWIGYNWFRKAAVRMAEGRVLEVASGTGFNSKYFDLDRVRSLTFLDPSRNMLELAEQRVTAIKRRIPVRFIVASLEDAQELKLGTFDTILQTNGLCSCKDPIAHLHQMKQLCRPGGRIILLEHGIGHYKWLNDILETYASSHCLRWGCIWNRDISDIMKSTGYIYTLKRRYLGTMYEVVIEN